MIHAIKHVRPMRGGAQAHMLADDNGSYWVVKFSTTLSIPAFSQTNGSPPASRA